MNSIIVKVQRPIEGNMEPMVLVYNQDHSLECMLPLTAEIRQAMGEDYKQFWHGHVEGSMLHLDKLAPWQEW